MRAGNLYHRINFFEKQITRDDYGASADTWDFANPTISTRGELRFTGGSKTLSNEEKLYSKNRELTIRYRPGIVETMKIQIDNSNDIWFITYIEMIGRNNSLRLTIEICPDGLTLLTSDKGLVIVNDAGNLLTDDSDNLIMQ